MMRGMVWLSQLGVASVLAWAAIPKILRVRDFAMDILAYDMVGWSTARLLAIWLPWLETSVALLILLGLWARASSAWVVILGIVFTIAKISALLRGLEIDCGCFGEGDSLTWASLGWNVILLAGGTMLFWKESYCWSVIRPKTGPSS